MTHIKIIDFEKKGNLVRFYLGDDSLTDYWGDDWDDTPYEHNAGSVYTEFVKAVRDIAFPFDSFVLEPCDGTINSRYSKDDMKNGICPCIIVVPEELAKSSYYDTFEYWKSAKGVQRYYFNDVMEIA